MLAEREINNIVIWLYAQDTHHLSFYKNNTNFEEFGITYLRWWPYYSEFKDFYDENGHGIRIKKGKQKKIKER